MSRPEIIVYRDIFDQICVSLDGGRYYSVISQWVECDHCYPEQIQVSSLHAVGIGDTLYEVWRSGDKS